MLGSLRGIAIVDRQPEQTCIPLGGLVVQQAAIVIGLLIEPLGFDLVANHFRSARKDQRALVSCLKVGPPSGGLNPAPAIVSG
jgi:hypothetical protein